MKNFIDKKTALTIAVTDEKKTVELGGEFDSPCLEN